MHKFRKHTLGKQTVKSLADLLHNTLWDFPTSSHQLSLLFLLFASKELNPLTPYFNHLKQVLLPSNSLQKDFSLTVYRYILFVEALSLAVYTYTLFVEPLAHALHFSVKLNVK